MYSQRRSVCGDTPLDKSGIWMWNPTCSERVPIQSNFQQKIPWPLQFRKKGLKCLKRSQIKLITKVGSSVSPCQTFNHISKESKLSIKQKLFLVTNSHHDVIHSVSSQFCWIKGALWSHKHHKVNLFLTSAKDRGMDCSRAHEMSVCTSVKEAEWLKCHISHTGREEKMNLCSQIKT